MNRRAFVEAAIGIVGGIALDKAIPRGRVWSFPSVINLRRFADGGYVTDPKIWLVGESCEDFVVPRGKLINECMDDLRHDIIIATGVQVRYFGISVFTQP